MTLDALRAREARLSLRIHTPPPFSLPGNPPDLDSLYKGQGFAWSNPYLDCRVWAMQLSTDRLPPPLLSLLEPLREAPQLADVLAAAESAEAYERDESLTNDAQWDCSLIGARLRVSAAFMGHYPSACIARHAVSVAMAPVADDAVLLLHLTTQYELRELAHVIVMDGFDVQKHGDRVALRERVWADMIRDAALIQFWRDLKNEDARTATGAVRDDTGMDPRDRDERADRIVSDLLDEAEPEPEVRDGPGLMVLQSVSHLPGGAKDGTHPSGSATTPRAEFAPLAGRRLPCVPPADLPTVRARLVSRFPHAAAVIDRMLSLAVGQRYARLRPVLLVGPPGCGKTRLSRDICEAMGLAVTVYSCSGVADASLIGTNRQWGTGRASVPLQAIKRAMKASVAIVVDEVEKASTSRHNGSAQDGLLSLLDHSARYHDPYLECDVDLSAVTYIATANSLQGITDPLRDRFLILAMPAPTQESLPVLVDGILADLRAETGQDEDWLPGLDGEEMEAVLANHRPGSSIRALRRLVEAVVSARAALSPRH